MGTIFENLKEYFKNTPKEQIQKDWDESEPFDKVGPTIVEFFNNQKRYKMDAYSNNELRSQLNDVCNVLDLSDAMLEKHGPIGTSAAELTRLVLEQKDNEIRMLKAGFTPIDKVFNPDESKDGKPHTIRFLHPELIPGFIPSNDTIYQGKIDDIINDLCEWNHHDDKEQKHLRDLEKRHDVEYISVTVEKHNQLQYTYYFELDFGTVDIYNVEIENGINNGTQVNHQGWGSSTKPESYDVEILKDVIFSEEKFLKYCCEKNISDTDKNFVRIKAEAIFNQHKPELLKLHKDRNYDNYVTGGGTHKTESSYNDAYIKLKEKGVFWEYIYKTQKADPNFL